MCIFLVLVKQKNDYLKQKLG